MSRRQWADFDGGAFGAGLLVWEEDAVIAVLLPGGKGSLESQVRRQFPDAEKAPEKSPARRWAKRLSECMLKGKPAQDVPFRLPDTMTPFQRAVLDACHRIPPGRPLSYAGLAKAAGVAGASRAAGSVMARNPLPLIIPCHRVVRSDGKTGNFGGGTPMKDHLLALEA